jgi:8-oxo-dGTP pyrophosphatase MutT (NUDIX family)
MIRIGDIRRSLANRVAAPCADQGLRPAAVLIPFFSSADGSLEVLFVQRVDDAPTHPGQIAFPGGAVEQGDRSRVETALRETEEELGIAREGVEVVGVLDELPTSSRFRVTPIVAHLAQRPSLTPNPAEVARAFWAPFEVFVSEETMEIRDIVDPVSGRDRKGVIHYRVRDVVVWGMTARTIKRLVDQLRG